MTKRKDILTTGQVAEICSVAPRTVTKWFDGGQLRGYRIPGSRDRRIPFAELIRFMRANNMPIDMLEPNRIRLMIIDSDWQMADAVSKALQEKDYQVELADNSFDAGVVAHKFSPHVIFINLHAENIDAMQICKNIRSNTELQHTKLVAVAQGLTENEQNALIQKGFDAHITQLGHIDKTIETIEHVNAILY